MDQIRIVRSKPRSGILTAWMDSGTREIYIRESLDHGRDIQTVCVSKKELTKLLELGEEKKEGGGL